MTGIYWLMSHTPMWAVALITYFLVIGLLFVIRDWREGLPYNISVASQQGDLALIGIILIGVEIVQKRHPLVLWMGNIQLLWLVVSVLVGVAWQQVSVMQMSRRKGTAADTYHNLFVVPLLVLLLGTFLPVVYFYGTLTEKMFAALFLLVWLGTMVFDSKRGRLQQTEWLARHGIPLPLLRVK